MKPYTSISDLVTTRTVALIVLILSLQSFVTATAQTPYSPINLSISTDSTTSTHRAEIQLRKADLNSPKNILLTLKALDTGTILKSVLINAEHIAGIKEEITGVFSHTQSHFRFTIDSLSVNACKAKLDVLEANDKVISFEETIHLPNQ